MPTAEERASQAAERAQAVPSLPASEAAVGDFGSDRPFSGLDTVPLSQQGSELSDADRAAAIAAEKANGWESTTEEEEWAAYLGQDEPEGEPQAVEEEASEPEEESSAAPSEVSMLALGRAVAALDKAGVPEAAYEGLPPERVLLLAQGVSGGGSQATETPAPYTPSAEVKRAREAMASELSEDSEGAIGSLLESLDSRNQQLEGMLRGFADREAMREAASSYPAEKWRPAAQEVKSLGQTLWRAGIDTGRYQDSVDGLAAAFTDAARQVIGAPRKAQPKAASLPSPSSGRRQSRVGEQVTQAEYDRRAAIASDMPDGPEKTKQLERLRQMRLNGRVGERTNPRFEGTSEWA